jgi:hypothetical protein
MYAWVANGEQNVAWAGHSNQFACMGWTKEAVVYMRPAWGRYACGTVMGGLEAWQGHVPEVQGVLGACHVHLLKQSWSSVLDDSLPVSRVQCVHGPHTVMTVLLNVCLDNLDV